MRIARGGRLRGRCHFLANAGPDQPSPSISLIFRKKYSNRLVTNFANLAQCDECSIVYKSTVEKRIPTPNSGWTASLMHLFRERVERCQHLVSRARRWHGGAQIAGQIAHRLDVRLLGRGERGAALRRAEAVQVEEIVLLS